MIEIKNITKSYDGNKNAIEDVSLDILPGEILGFIGPNGAGKTTTMKILTGLLSPDSGSVVLNGFDIVKDSTNAKKEFGFVADDPNAFLKLKGIEYLNFMADMYEVSSLDREQRILEFSKVLSIEDALNQKISSYSHGMRQKIMVIASLLHNPNLLILDEPLTGLDPQSSRVLKNLMRQRADEGKSVIFSTHVLEIAEKLCDQIAIIDGGKIIYKGTLKNLQSLHADLSLEDIFLVMTHA